MSSSSEKGEGTSFFAETAVCAGETESLEHGGLTELPDLLNLPVVPDLGFVEK